MFVRSPRFFLPGLLLAATSIAAVFGGQSLPAAEDGDLAVQIWSIEQGLPNSTVTALAQTRDGYLWVGTFNGLARFDGVRFVTFNPANTPAMKHARVQRLFVDAEDTLWINTYDGALISFRDGVFAEEWKSRATLPSAKISPVPTRGREILFAVESGELIRRPLGANQPGQWTVLRPPIERRENAIYCEDDAGVLWCLTRDYRVWQVQGDTFVPVASVETLGSQPRRLVTDQAGKLWVCTNRDILRWNGTRFESMLPTGADGPLDVQFLFFPREGGYWTIADGRFRKMVDRQWTQEVAEWQSPLNLDFPIYQQMYQDRQGGLWFAPPHRGVFYLSPDGQPKQLGTSEGLPTDSITTWLEDREGNIWLGAEHGGLTRLRKKSFNTLQLGGDLPAAPAMSVCEDRDNAMWVGTFGNGLIRTKQGRTERFLASNEPQGRYAFSAFPDANGQIWVSAGWEDLYLVANGTLQPAPWSAHGIKALFVDHNDRVWVGTKDQLFCIVKGKLQIIEPFSSGNRHEVRAITEDCFGNIWIGLGSGELYRYDNSKCVVFKPVDLAESYPIWSLCPDQDGTVWVGTFGGGLLRMKDGRFTRYTKKAGLPDDVISQILDDGRGHLWIGSYQGVFRIGKEALRAFGDGEISTVPSLVFGRHDGLPSLECTGGYQPAAWQSHDGTLWFTTVGGVAYIAPAKLSVNSSPTSVVVESVIVDGETQAPPRGTRDGRSAGRAKPGVLEIPAGAKHLEFQYTGLCFASPDQVRFRYKLEGIEQAWNEVGTRRFAQYTYLHPGSYRLLVSACNSDGVWNEAGAALAIRVLPYFWQTWWFIGLFGTTAISALAAAVHRISARISTRRLRQKLQVLQRQRAVQEDRARIARDIHDDLGAGLTQITLFSELLRRAPANGVDEHVRHISETAEALTRAMDEIVWAVNPKNDTLESLISYICSFAQEYLRSAHVKCRLDIPAQLPLAPISSELRHNLYVSTKEALNNVLKHAGAAEVWIRLQLDRETFTLTIEDDGCGMRSDEPGGANRSRLSSGHGLNNLKSRMAAVGGECRIAAGSGGRGIRIALQVPFRKEPPADG
jgi:ligand-binding sensor domain-containing protein/signal transduction histidine kinase